jgi:hypothetical protein
MTTTKQSAATGAEVDAALSATAQGVAPTSDDADALDEDSERETDVVGHAAGVAVRDGKPLGGPDEIERRDAHRWENDPASADDFAAREQEASVKPPTRLHVRVRPLSRER